MNNNNIYTLLSVSVESTARSRQRLCHKIKIENKTVE